MEGLVRGEVVVINFPFSNLKGLKKRPALVLKEISGDDLVLCQITGRSFDKSEEVLIDRSDFIEGNLRKESHVRFTKLFTADKSSILYKVGKIEREKVEEITESLCEYLQ